ncbi:mannan endo-1,4-beta-mannosidase-like [Crassostrea angulata]|uniref:mannan endo-1,4-beta-mannosidase-like n=1 Tax=Magallana angulata TaxID=2784310 RepID=UPI0022B158C6|nr:mannan endo-1,4-beta-mannosidase-like [Crassostrea angulata]
MWWIVFIGLFLLADLGSGARLGIHGTNFTYDGNRVFLAGINKAWEHYAYDFGNGQYNGVKARYEHVFQQLQAAGANSIRIWIHIEGESSPKFDSNGHVTGTDNGGTLINDMRDMLRAAQQHNIFVFPTLWNGALNQNYHYRLNGLIQDTSKLNSYIDRALKPMVLALKDMPSLGGWDLMNEPEGELIPNLTSTDPCLDTRHLLNSGAGWAGKLYTPQELLRFFNWQAAAIKEVDPHALVTVGAWNGKVNTDNFGFHNMYKDSCLVKAGGKALGTFSFYQIHSYAYNGYFGTESPFMHNFSAFGLNKPLVIGEFREKNGAGMTIDQLYDHAYNGGYAGGWGWSETDGNMDNMLQGLNHIRNYSGAHGTIHVQIHYNGTFNEVTDFF